MIQILHASDHRRAEAGELYRASQQLFGGEDKMSWAADKYFMTGYVPLAKEVTDSRYGADPKELWHICRFENIQVSDQRFYPPNIFPASLPEAEETFKNLFRDADKMASHFLRSLAYKYPEHASQLERFHGGHNILRLLHYPDLVDSKINFAIPPHRDSALFSILLFQKGGRFFFKEDGGWKQFAALEDQMLILPGLMLELITDGKIQAVEHYVEPMAEGGAGSAERFSGFYFVHPRPYENLRYRDPQDATTEINIPCGEFLWKHAEELNLPR